MDKVPLKPGTVHGGDGQLIGADPRKLGPAGLRELGHRPVSPLQALRERCIDCCTGSKTEVAKCVAVTCPSWPFRTGHNPWRTGRPMTPEQRNAAASHLKHGRTTVPREG